MQLERASSQGLFGEVYACDWDNSVDNYIELGWIVKSRGYRYIVLQSRKVRAALAVFLALEVNAHIMVHHVMDLDALDWQCSSETVQEILGLGEM